MRAAPHTQTASPYIPADSIHIRNPHISQFPHIDLMPAETGAGLRWVCTDGPSYASAAPQQFTKIHKVRSFTSCKSIRCCHAPQIPIWAILPYHQSDPTFAKTCAGFGRSTEHSWRIVTPAGLIPAETSGRSTQTYAPDRLTQIPCADEGGMGVRVRRRFAMRRRRRCDVDDSGASTCMCDRAIGPRGPITVKPKGLTGLRARLWSGLKAGLVARLKARRMAHLKASPPQAGS